MRIAFHTLGCKVNQYETEVLKNLFAARGYDVVSEKEPADVYVINSCTVTAVGDKKTRQMLRRYKRENPGAKVVLTGCVPQAYPTVADDLPEADVITGSKNRAALVELVQQAVTTGQRIVEISPHVKEEPFEEMQANSMGEKTRAFIKIEDGCDRYCAYCIIPTARGPVRSKPLSSLKAELIDLSGAGYREVVLTGINLSLYGTDTGNRLTDAVALACSQSGIERVRIGSLEPHLITEEDIRQLAKQEKLCPQFHLSLQSGCDTVLRRMNRPYNTDVYRAQVALLRRLFQNAAITTDIIVGFPGETDAEFEATLAFAKEIGFARIHVFPYSVRPGTAAAAMDGQVPPKTKQERAARLSALAEKSTTAFYTAQTGKRAEVLFETAPKPGCYTGYAKNYVPVTANCAEDLRGKILPVDILTASFTGCTGAIAGE